jgi:N-acetylornithine carbamoyltransferase
MTDIFSIQERFPRCQNKKITIAWAYHPKPLPMSVPNSIAQISTMYGMDVTLACPPGYELSDPIMEVVRQNADQYGGSFKVTHDDRAAYEDADVVYVKSWGSIKAYGDPRAEKKLRMPHRGTWICDQAHMDRTASTSIFMHCLPVRRNVVVTDEVIDGPRSIVYDQAENRLHVQKSLLYSLMRNPFFDADRGGFY